jgi:transcriptional regulator with XRE-family HTH domain
MTPFGRQLRAFRTDHELAQGDFARLLGFRQSYISAIECGSKLPKDDKLIIAAVAVLRMNPGQEAALRQALILSQPSDFPPPGTPFFAYDLCARVMDWMPRLTTSDATAFTAFLDHLEQQHRPLRPVESDLRENAV